MNWITLGVFFLGASADIGEPSLTQDNDGKGNVDQVTRQGPKRSRRKISHERRGRNRAIISPVTDTPTTLVKETTVVNEPSDTVSISTSRGVNQNVGVNQEAATTVPLQWTVPSETLPPERPIDQTTAEPFTITTETSAIPTTILATTTTTMSTVESNIILTTHTATPTVVQDKPVTTNPRLSRQPVAGNQQLHLRPVPTVGPNIRPAYHEIPPCPPDFGVNGNINSIDGWNFNSVVNGQYIENSAWGVVCNPVGNSIFNPNVNHNIPPNPVYGQRPWSTYQGPRAPRFNPMYMRRNNHYYAGNYGNIGRKGHIGPRGHIGPQGHIGPVQEPYGLEYNQYQAEFPVYAAPVYSSYGQRQGSRRGDLMQRPVSDYGYPRRRNQPFLRNRAYKIRTQQQQAYVPYYTVPAY